MRERERQIERRIMDKKERKRDGCRGKRRIKYKREREKNKINKYCYESGYYPPCYNAPIFICGPNSGLNYAYTYRDIVS